MEIPFQMILTNMFNSAKEYYLFLSNDVRRLGDSFSIRARVR